MSKKGVAKTFFEMTGHLEVEHDEGVDLEYLRECTLRSFLLLPTIITKDSKVYCTLRGGVKARRISSKNMPPPVKMMTRYDEKNNKLETVAASIEKKPKAKPVKHDKKLSKKHKKNWR